MNRDAMLPRLREPCDVLIIGGGATGLGAAVDAVTRGYRTALIEAVDFAKATSSRSTKLIHGGVRYLQSGDVALVREALHERRLLRANAPHLVTDLPFIVPAYRWYEAAYYFVGLQLYDLLAGKSNFGRSRHLSRRDTLERMPGLRAPGLRGSSLYHDGQFDDARLAIALARTAADHGAAVANYVRAERFLYEQGRVCGVVARDLETNEEIEVRARAVVNATGIFADELRRLDNPKVAPLLSLSRGTHVVFPRSVFETREALLVPKTDDGRVLFAIPWHQHVLVGTTDVEVASSELDPAPSAEEIDYIIAHFNRYLARPVERAMALSTFAGLRPLVNRHAATTAKLSREHVVETSRSGLVTITGGKWTTYRKMAQDAIDAAARAARLPAAPCVTTELPLHGSPGIASRTLDAFGLYGTDGQAIRALIDEDASLAELIHPRLPYTRAEIVFAARFEMARTLDDALSRRTRAFFLDLNAAVDAALQVAMLLAAELGRPPQWEAEQVDLFRSAAQRDALALN
jgi:glycerol-3-phosphate dehydrogenase